MESRPLPFLAVGRIQDAVTLAHYTIIEDETQAAQVKDIFCKLLVAAPKKLGKGDRTRLQWGDGSIVCVTGLRGVFFYCVFTSNLTYPEALAYRLLYDMTVAVDALPGAEEAPEDGLNDKLNSRMRELIEQYEAKNSSKELELNGSWSSLQKPDTIKNISGGNGGIILTWANGDAMPLRIINARSFEVSSSTAIHCGELKDDDRLHWNDGDVWFRREAQLTGAWSNQSNPGNLKHIQGEALTWANGEVTALQIHQRKLKFHRNGKSHTGELRDDDKIYWDDGDVWYHREATAKGIPGGARIFGIKLF